MENFLRNTDFVRLIRRKSSSKAAHFALISALKVLAILNCLFNNSFVISLQQNETALEIAQRKNLHDIMQILQQYQHKSPRNTSKYPEKSVDDTTEEEFDVDAIMKDPTYEDSESFGQQITKPIQSKSQARLANQMKQQRDRSSSSSKENHHSRRSRRSKKKNPDPDIEPDPELWSPYGYHPQVSPIILYQNMT